MAKVENHAQRVESVAVGRNRLFVAILALAIGSIGIYVAYAVATGFWRETTAAGAAAVLGAGLLALIDRLSMRDQYDEAKRRDDIAAALGQAFRHSENLREDGMAHGIRRILTKLEQVQNQIPFGQQIQGANIVYILGTTVTRTAVLKAVFQQNPNTEFRFLLVSPAGIKDEGVRNVVLRACHLIHDSPIANKSNASLDDLKSISEELSHVKYKTLSFIPTFSAVLAMWNQADQITKGWLQIDHYLVRTRSDSRVWLVIEPTSDRECLFNRYRKLIEEMWNHPGRYDLGGVKPE